MTDLIQGELDPETGLLSLPPNTSLEATAPSALSSIGGSFQKVVGEQGC
ncbi:MAG: hypothetical protein WBW48_10425 [Anaerolineae bacterium]